MQLFTLTVGVGADYYYCTSSVNIVYNKQQISIYKQLKQWLGKLNDINKIRIYKWTVYTEYCNNLIYNKI